MIGIPAAMEGVAGQSNIPSAAKAGQSLVRKWRG
jgi:hypothetical protein